MSHVRLILLTGQDTPPNQGRKFELEKPAS